MDTSTKLLENSEPLKKLVCDLCKSEFTLENFNSNCNHTDLIKDEKFYELLKKDFKILLGKFLKLLSIRKG